MEARRPKKEEAMDAVPAQGEHWLRDLLQRLAAQESQGAKTDKGSPDPVSRKTVERLIDKVTARS